MAASLIDSLEKIHLDTSASDGTADDWIDSILEEQRPRKRVKQDQEQLRRLLEQKYLTPSISFSPEWLNKLQQ
jgi:antiviral helicase SKI2